MEMSCRAVILSAEPHGYYRSVKRTPLAQFAFFFLLLLLLRLLLWKNIQICNWGSGGPLSLRLGRAHE